MFVLENDDSKTVIHGGIIKEIYDKKDEKMINLSMIDGIFGAVSYTIVEEKLVHNNDFEPYVEKTSNYDLCEYDNDAVFCRDKKNDIYTKYYLNDDGINIATYTLNSHISQFAINIGFNYIGKGRGDYENQVLPTSPYISDDKRYAFCIMTRPYGRYIVVMAKNKCIGFRNTYSSEDAGHSITGFQLFSDFDKEYQKSDNKKIEVTISFTDNISTAYELISKFYNVPYCYNIISGSFDGNAMVFVSNNTDEIIIKSPSGKQEKINTYKKNIHKIEMTEFGFYTVIPYSNGKPGIDSRIWNGCNIDDSFIKSCNSIKKPYHGDENLCEGGCFLWAMLLNMKIYHTKKYNDIATEELDKIMGKNNIAIRRRTILPYKTKEYDAYHICNSKRVQEQFFGVSILLEAYRLYNNKEILEFAISALSELVKNYITADGMIYNGSDYTTVCAPVIAIVDMSNHLKRINDERYKLFEKTAVNVAEFLIKRGLDFPTEGMTKEKNEKEAEDGSISCTALSVLYVCKNLHYDERYVCFARKVLKLHNAWTIYTSDARMQQSSFRWWETIWEGDGEGPAVCAGHAWTIWRAEALFIYGLLTMNDDALINSWNGFITNFCKADKDGNMYACFEVDYIRGGGKIEIKQNQAQLKGEDLSVKRVLGNSYPKHYDSSLSRYAWVRATYTWLNTAAIFCVDGEFIAINAKEENGVWHLKNNISTLYIGKMEKEIYCECKHKINLYSKNKEKVHISLED